MQKLTAYFEMGLAREGGDVMVKMYCTYIHSLPDGSEKGEFLILDLGEMEFRIHYISKICTNDIDHMIIA